MAGPSSAELSPGDESFAVGEGFAVPDSEVISNAGAGSACWDQPVRACPMWPPELALPAEESRRFPSLAVRRNRRG